MRSTLVLWTDDEIDLLKPYVLFLEGKGYTLHTASNGSDAISLATANRYDAILLDENMPGLSGLETLTAIKKIDPTVPIIMVTKSEEENIMDQAIGSKIADYLIKPVNPNQVLLALKKATDKSRLITERTNKSYQAEFSQLGNSIAAARSFDDWKEVYRSLVFWELELAQSEDNAMAEVLLMQKNEANSAFCKYIRNNYLTWFAKDNETRPMMSPNVMKQRVYPLLDKYKQVFLILVDNLRLDQWKVIETQLRNLYHTDTDDLYCSILPTATQYSRNSLFAGLMPSEIDKLFPDIWLNDDEEGGKNLHEAELLKKQHQRLGRQESLYYDKILNNRDGKRINENLHTILNNGLVVLVYNFVDMLSHARTEMEMIRELAADEAAYRTLTLSWFQHSPLRELIETLAAKNIPIVLTTDHGSIKVDKPVKVIGDRNTTTNLRYKQGKNLNYNPKEVFEITDPAKAYLPKSNLSSTYIFSQGDEFFAYPNNYNHYVKYYRNTFQHGGVSLEEMLIPLITLLPKA